MNQYVAKISSLGVQIALLRVDCPEEKVPDPPTGIGGPA
jgi:hypothetical protein